MTAWHAVLWLLEACAVGFVGFVAYGLLRLLLRLLGKVFCYLLVLLPAALGVWLAWREALLVWHAPWIGVAEVMAAAVVWMAWRRHTGEPGLGDIKAAALQEWHVWWVKRPAHWRFERRPEAPVRPTRRPWWRRRVPPAPPGTLRLCGPQLPEIAPGMWGLYEPPHEEER